MINKQEAIDIAEVYLDGEAKNSGYELVLLYNEIMEFEFGWVFFYQSKAYVESGDYLDMLGGNSPFIINRYDGSLFVTGTGDPIEKYIEEYVKERKSQNNS